MWIARQIPKSARRIAWAASLCSKSHLVCNAFIEQNTNPSLWKMCDMEEEAWSQ